MGLPGLPTTTDVLLELDLTRGLVDAPPGTPLAMLRARGVPVLRDVVEALRRAAGDDRVKGLVCHVGQQPIDLARSGELRRAVRAFARSGKPTVAWTEAFGEAGPGNTAYHLATGFEEIWLQPAGDVGLTGVVAEALFIRGALDKLHVTPQFGQRHEYKSAADTFMREEMTEANREMAARLAESATEVIVADVAEGRGLSVEAVRAAMEEAPIPAERAVELGLVDRLGHRDEVLASLRRRVTGDAAAGDAAVAEEEPSLQYVDRYGKGLAAGPQGILRALRQARGGQPTIAVVYASGAIVTGRTTPSPLASDSPVGSDTLNAALRAAGRDESVKAVVLRVDSPGGSYVASDAVRHQVHALRAAGTPVVASMGGVAASGGYYIAMGADEVLADPGTLTGSIGVLAGKAVTTEALERLGITREAVAATERAEMFSSRRPFTDEEWQRLDAWLDRVYDDFTAKAAVDRGMDVERLRELARGRVWTGADAADNGLVDGLGGLDEAIDAACRRAGVARDDVAIRVLPKPNLLERLLPAESSEQPAAAAVRALGVAVGLGPAQVGQLSAALGLGAGSGGAAGTAGPLVAPVVWRLR